MEGRRVTRGRLTKDEGTRRKASPARTRHASPPPAKRASPGRKKVSPVRRSSRPRSVALGSVTSTVTVPSPVKEVKETKPSPRTRTNFPTTLTTNTSTRSPIQTTSTSSVHSSYSSTTQKTVEIRSSAAVDDRVITKIADYIRRSVSKSKEKPGARRRQNSHTPNTEVESRYSRSISRSVYGDEDKSSDNEKEKSVIAEDDEDEEHYKSFSAVQQQGVAAKASPRVWRKVDVPREFGGAWGIGMLLLLLPLLVYYLQWTCSKTSCGFKAINLNAILDSKYLLEKVFHREAVGAYLAFNSAVFVLSGLVFGRHVQATSELWNLNYNFNTLPIAIILTVAAGVAEFFKYPIADFVLRHYLRFCLYGLVNAFIVAQSCYLRTKIQMKDAATQLNPYGKTGNYLIDFGLGRQLNPKWLGYIDYKQAFYRISLLTTLIFAECFIYKRVQVPTLPVELQDTGAFEAAKYYINNLQYDAGAILAASLLLFYILDAIIFEHHLASSFELQGEGFGYLLLLRYVCTPYLLCAVAKFFYDRRMPTITHQYAIYVSWALLISGLILKRLSSAIKYKYRTDPKNPHFYGMDTVHTYQGRRLLLGNFWGRLRQPNYAGDIIALIALGLPLLLRFSWPPLISLGLLIILLLHRAVRVNARNTARYHSSWVRYCVKVPNYVIPKIY